METHEYAQLFPPASDDELIAMADDIKVRGLLCPVITLDGRVLDGRNRLRACEMAGVEPTFRQYTGTDPLADVISWNLKRRHLSPSQHAVIASEIANMRQGERTDLQPSANLPKVSQAEAAQIVGVSERLVRDAVKVRNDAPELHEQVKAGRLTVNAARREVKQRETERASVLRNRRKSASSVTAEDDAAAKSRAMDHATDAIRCLNKIKPDDPLRQEALWMVIKWCQDHE